MPKTTPLTPMAEWLQIESTPADWDAVGRDELLRMQFHLHLIRAFEEAVLQVHNDGLVHGPAHSSIGQERQGCRGGTNRPVAAQAADLGQ